MGLEAGSLNREQTLHLALAMGKALLKNGAETSRVEDTIVICMAITISTFS